uniref:T-lymphoma invasion and metastasis-inducing protein 1-like n=1 Tax=Sinocyclocheilus rhinocerous TaxID=307959 RepID=A0A673JSP1_9TELE
MGNTESHSGGHGYYGDGQRHLSRKHMSRSLRLSSKQTYCSRRTPSGKPEHRNSETSTRSSSTPSIPQSLADHGLEPFNDSDMLPNFSGPIWVDRVAMNLRPMSFHNHPAHSPAATAKQATQDDTEPPEDTTLVQRTRDSSQEASSFKKKRSKSADMWREDSLEVSLSDLSQEHLTSTEEIGDTPDDCETCLQSSAQELLDSNRANSLDELYGPKSPACRPTHGRYAKWHKGGGTSREGDEDKMISPCEDDGAAYSAYTLPCRRSHCLSEGPTNHQGVMQGRRAQTIQDVTAGDGSDYEDSGIDGLTGDSEASQHHARRYKTMSVSFSAYSTSAGAAFAGSDSGSMIKLGVYENFRQELEQNVSPVEVPEERSSAFSDEQSSVTLSSAYHTDPLLNVAAVQGTVRKAGRLAIKNFLVHKKNKKVELAPRRKWKSYWVSLKGCTLFFYETDGRSGIDHNSVPKHAVWAENSIVQAVPEHPKKDFVFCLSNSLGDSFLFQTCSQTELENWITAIHSACAAAVARQHHREDTVRLLRAEIRKLEQKIDMDEKMKKMGDMQLSAVTDAKKRKTILEQIFLWEQNLEQFHMDLIIPFTSFRFRCYLSSLQGGELPNPKRLLAFASRPTKLAMGRLGIFSVSSFHALVAARTESGVRRRTQAMSRSTSKRKSRFSSLWGLDTHSKRKSKGHPSINQVFAEGDDPVKNPLEGMFEGSSSDTTKDTKTPVKGLPRPSADHDIWSRDHLTPSWVLLPNDQPVLAIIQPGESALDMLETICKAHQLDPTKHYVRLKLLIENQVQFYIPKPEEDIYDLVCFMIILDYDVYHVISLFFSGFSISVVEEDSVQQLYITDVKAGGLAFAKGSLSTEQVAAFCRSLHEMNPSSEVVSSSSGPESSSLPPSNATPRQLSDADKLRKVICELVETERTYVKDLNYLIGRYLTPLQKESFLTQDELDVLFGNLPEMLEFQVEFLKTLEDGTRLVPDLEKLERVEEFKVCGSFGAYTMFFCTCVIIIPCFLRPKTDAAFKAFLDERNPKQQHSSTLESYLIKPIQRVLKYPLLLRELHSLTDPDSEEHYHLNIAMKAMNTVASHINEMQKIHEEFGAVFDLLISEHAGDKKEVADLSMGDLLLHTSVTWINPSSSLGKCKKEPQLATFGTFSAQLFATLIIFRNVSEQQIISAPTRTLGRRKLVRNRFTIDTDIVFDTEPDSDSPDSQHAQQQGIVPAGDTDRWVEEQFDLQRYEEQEQDVKETDILSDDDEFCQSALSPSTDPDVEGPLSALSLEGDTAEEEEEEEEDGKKDYKSQHAKLSHLGKQCAMSVASVDEQVPGEDIWVRRDSVPRCR